jgi:hypothetical protein
MVQSAIAALIDFDPPNFRFWMQGFWIFWVTSPTPQNFGFWI